MRTAHIGASCGLSHPMRQVTLPLRASKTSRRFSHCEYTGFRIFSQDVRGPAW